MKCRKGNRLQLYVILLVCLIASALSPRAHAQEDATVTAGRQPAADPTFVLGGAADPVPTEVDRAQGTGKVAALTVDDGPNPDETGWDWVIWSFERAREALPEAKLLLAGAMWKESAYLIDWFGEARPALRWLRKYLEKDQP